MPPEPLPWDRNRDKKHDRSDSIRSVARWRDSHHGGCGSATINTRDFGSNRWDDFRRPPPGHGKQGGYQLFSEDSAHGFMPFRVSSDRMVSDDNSFRSSPIVARGGGYGKYGRNTRDTRGSFSHKEPRGGYAWDSTDTSSVARQQYDITTQRSVSDLITYASHPPSHIDTSSWDHLDFKDHHDKHPSIDALGAGHRYDREQSLGPFDWKPLKWNRSSSLSSRCSGFSHTSSSRSMGTDSDETKPDLPSGRLTPAQSPSGDALASAAGCGTGSILPNASFEETCPRKKQRLGWGQGLAKYEKQKVEGSDETFSRNILVPCSTTSKPSQTVPCLSEKSPRLTGPSECASPVTTSSFACSSSPGIDDKPQSMTENNDIGTCNLSDSPTRRFQSCLVEFSASLDHLNCATNLSNLLNDLLQTEDASSGDSDFVKSTAMHKLLQVKSELSKALEKTECEIDLFENELKTLNTESESGGPQMECTRICENVDTFSKMIQSSAPLQLVSSSDMHVEIPDLCNESVEEVHEEVKDVDSPGTATSKFAGPLCVEKAVSTFGPGKYSGCSLDVVTSSSASSEKPRPLPFVNTEETAIVFADSKIEGSIDAHDLGYLRSGCSLIDVILGFNKASAREAFELFSKLLSAGQSEFDIWGSCGISCQKNNLRVKEKLALRKCSRRIKEKVLTLKFRALHHLWKEDMRLLSVKKYKAKSQKRVEFNSRPPHNVYQKHRSSIRSRFISPGSLTLVPTPEIVDLTSKLLSDSQMKVCRDNLRMPCLVDDKEKKMLRFVSSNGLVEDPCAAEKERVMVNPWMAEEREVFLEKLATFGKDFKKIASFLDHKTTADCVEFYYKNHKSESFEKIKKKSEVKKQERVGSSTNKYMLTPGTRWNREVNTASLVLLGEASVIAAADADNDESKSSEHTYMSRSPSLGYHRKTCWEDDMSFEKSSSLDDEREATAADMLAGLSSEAMSSCVTSCVEPGESCQEKAMEIVEDDEEETCSDESSGEMDSVDWTDEEKLNFIDAVRCYGKDFVKIARRVRSRSRDQCKVFFSKARKSLGLDVIHRVNNKGGATTTLSDASGGGGGSSDTEDTFVFETAECSTYSCSKLDAECLSSVNRQVSASDDPKQQLQTDEIAETIEISNSNLLHTDDDVPERSGESSGGPLSAAAEVGVVEKSKPLVCDEEMKIQQDDNVSKVEDTAVNCDLGAARCSAEEGVNQEQTCDAVDEVEHSMKETTVSSGETAKIESQIRSPEGGLEPNLTGRSISGIENGESLLTDSSHHQQQSLMHSKSVNEKKTAVISEGSLILENGQGLGLEESSNIEEYVLGGRALNPHHHQQAICSQSPSGGYLRVDGGSINGDCSTSSEKCNDCLQLAPHSHCHGRVGDVKLFGQILSHPSSFSSSSSSTTLHKHPEMSTVSLYPKPSSSSSSSSNMFDLKSKTTTTTTTSSSNSNNSRCEPPGGNNYSIPSSTGGLLNDFSSRSYGFWDGSRIQTGLSSLPDPSILVAKYPPAAAAAAAFNTRDYSAAAAPAADEQSLMTRGDRIFLPLMGRLPNNKTTSCSNLIVPDYHHVQVYRRGYDGGANLQQLPPQPFAVEVKQHLQHDGLLFSDIQQQQQNSGLLEGISSYQQHSRGNLGSSVVGISDPVAAIKMHYAAASTSATTMEHDPWRGVGDLGR